MIRFAYLGLFSVTQASIPEVSKVVMDARAGSSFWQIGSVRSTRWSNMDCKSGKKSCLKRVNLEASGTTSNHKKCRIYAAFGVSQTPNIPTWKKESASNRLLLRHLSSSYVLIFSDKQNSELQSHNRLVSCALPTMRDTPLD